MSVPYILGRSFHPLDLPACPSATPSPHSRRTVSGLCESVLEESLRVHMREIDVWVRVYLCSAEQITRHISSLESRQSPFRLSPSDLTRRRKPFFPPPRLVNFVGTSWDSFLSFAYFFIYRTFILVFHLTRKIAINVTLKNCKIWNHFVNIILS